MRSDFSDASPSQWRIEASLDGLPVSLPPQRRTFAAIRSYLEGMAMENQRVLCTFTINNEPAGAEGLIQASEDVVRVAGETMALEQLPLQLVENAMRQTAQVHEQVVSAVAQTVINDAPQAHEIWWNLSRELKQPLLMLSFLPDTACGSAGRSGSLGHLRKHQLHELAGVMKAVDAACESSDPTALSDALESRVLPWLGGLQESLDSLRHALLAECQVAQDRP